MKAMKGFVSPAVLLLGTVCVCAGLPHALFYAAHGRMPLAAAQKPFAVPIGSTTEETIEALGPPHDKLEHGDGTQTWYYDADILGIIIYSMQFDAEGRLGSVWS